MKDLFDNRADTYKPFSLSTEELYVYCIIFLMIIRHIFFKTDIYLFQHE